MTRRRFGFIFAWGENRGFARSSPREQQSTGLLHLDFRISFVQCKKRKIPNGIFLFLVTRRRFELRTHCLKGNCSASWASGSYGWDGRIWTYECQSQSLVPYRLATSQCETLPGPGHTGYYNTDVSRLQSLFSPFFKKSFNKKWWNFPKFVVEKGTCAWISRYYQS